MGLRPCMTTTLAAVFNRKRRRRRGRTVRFSRHTNGAGGGGMVAGRRRCRQQPTGPTPPPLDRTASAVCSATARNGKHAGTWAPLPFPRKCSASACVIILSGPVGSSIRCTTSQTTVPSAAAKGTVTLCQKQKKTANKERNARGNISISSFFFLFCCCCLQRW